MITARVPAAHRDAYEAAARQASLPLGDYVALMLAKAHDLPEPEYVRQNKNQPELEIAIGAA